MYFQIAKIGETLIYESSLIRNLPSNPLQQKWMPSFSRASENCSWDFDSPLPTSSEHARRVSPFQTTAWIRRRRSYFRGLHLGRRSHRTNMSLK
ncbi:hypothetical protein TNCT_717591 [Trichonephila clavata]|uniref:Uncharacterized protein n=1 Tax=Trichonephila clavata TaxID=2740835 RepID=A0A8X6F3N5_TRICU|nr:hypothetical protein TNCT_717591 [Trichonephila clavata]